MSRIATSAINATTAAVLVQIKRAAGKVRNTFAAIGAYGPATPHRNGPKALLGKRALASASMVVVLGSIGPAMAESILAQSERDATRQLTLVDSVTSRTDRQLKHYQGIIGGHRLQPTENELNVPNVSANDAKIVDELYRKLIQEEKAIYPELFRLHPSSTDTALPTALQDKR